MGYIISNVPIGYREVDKSLYAEMIISQGISIDRVDGIFIGKGEIVITGSPISDDENHNCDMMGCSSISHVLYRTKL
jgi:hypothetical protein